MRPLKTVCLPVVAFFCIGAAFLIHWARLPAAAPGFENRVVYYHTFPSGPLLKDTLKIVSYNLGYASGAKNNLGNELTKDEILSNIEDAAAALRPLEADIICLQEVDFDARRSHRIDQLDALAKRLRFPYAAYAVNWNKNYVPYPYWPPQKHFGHIVSGQGILSRYKFTETSVTTLKRPPHPFWYDWFYLDRLAQKAEIAILRQISGRPRFATVTVWNVHLEAFDARTRIEQAKSLVELTSDNSSAFKTLARDSVSRKILAGDFNDPQKETPAGQDAVSLLLATRIWRSENPSSREYFTFPSWRPEEKIDHILYSGAMERTGAGVLSSKASDHLPVWLDLKYTE